MIGTAAHNIILMPRAYEQLERFLARPDQPAGTMGLVELHGFLFARDRIELLVTVSSRVRLAGFLMHLYRNVGGFGVKGTQEIVKRREDAEAKWRAIHSGRVVAIVSSARAVRAGIEMIGVWNGVAYHVPVVPLPRRLTVVEAKHVAA